MNKLKKFIPITKVDVEQRLVYGTATAEEPDMSGEVCDYATTKPFYEKWSGNIAKATDGKSVGNLRSMHSHIAAGKLTSLNFDDAAKRIEICGKVVDDGEWNKVLEGVYTGFSQGGKYVKRWKDPTNGELTRYTAEPIEVSLVDVPCLPSATFEAIKGAGVTELRKFATVIAEPSAPVVAAKAEEMAKAAGNKPLADFVLPAREALMKAAAAKAVEEMPDADAEAKPEPKVDAGKAADGDWTQVWVHPRLPGKQFGKKAELQQALVDLDADEAAKTAGAGVTAALAAIGQELDKHDGGVKKVAFGAVLADQIDKRDDALQASAAMSDADWDIAVAFGEQNSDHAAVKALGASIVSIKDGAFAIPAETADALKAVLAAAKAAPGPAPKPAKGEKALKGAIKIARASAADIAKARKPEDAAALIGKSLYDVGRLASLISELSWLQDSLNFEALVEADGSLVPDQLKASIGSLCAVLRLLVNEETAELVGDDLVVIEVFEMAAGMLPHGHIDNLVKFVAGTPGLAKFNDAFQKIGARHSKADVGRINKMHELSVDLGAECGGDADKHQPGGDLVKLKAERNAFAKIMADIAPMLAETLERVKRIETTPLPGGPRKTHVISKDGEGLGSGGAVDIEKMVANMSPEEKINLAFKLAQSNGRTLQIGGPAPQS